MIIGDLIYVSVQIPAILKDDESVGAVAAVSRWGLQHQAAADGNTEEGLQEPDRDSTQHIAQKRQSSCQDLFPRIDEDTKGSVDCLL